MFRENDAQIFVTRLAGALIVSAHVTPADTAAGDIEVAIFPGERFGGRDFTEWAAIADSAGCVPASWLLV